ncbi:hypothetical protein DFH11DRAFT_189018 [Phellopilus nigrolimitatus]|nr:hypothetical protein DFH11DRAFT_395374 [Phellopilus nigrolimitatus]KAH8114799.1 hypothetical protein DFH11DRAFT_189018 [Phellopilus nigrolimitatus]
MASAEEVFVNLTLESEVIFSQADGQILHQQDNEDDIWAVENLNEAVMECINDFHEVDNSPAGKFAEQMASNHIAEGTFKGYRRIICDYIMTMRTMKGIRWNPVITTRDTPKDIVLMIAHKCGPIESRCEGKKFATAVSTRAALSYWYGAVRPGESTSTWTVDKYDICHGLPTRAELVSRFMRGLQKRKAKLGDSSTSARAVTYEDMINLYSICIEDQSLTDAQRRAGVVRYAVYLFAWLLLERLGETLELEFRNIDFRGAWFGVQMLTRKNAQTGETHEMRLYANDLDPKICPMRVLLRMVGLYGKLVSATGPLFLSVSASGKVEPHKRMTASSISRMLHSDLQKLHYKSWSAFGTHSFRRGGCQFRMKHRNWSPDMVAAWGGWSQQEAVTMFRYFFSPNDNHELLNEYDLVGLPVAKRQRLY